MVKLFVEGPNDENFVATLIRHFSITKKQHSIIVTDGWEKIALLKNIFQQNKDIGGKNFIIFDADSDHTKRKSDIKALLDNQQVIDDIYLFPDNLSAGNLESLLIQAMNVKHSPLNNCFDAYRSCIGKLNATYKKPDDKTKVFAYLSVLGKPEKEIKRDYSDSDAWDTSNKLIQNFVAYLKKILN